MKETTFLALVFVCVVLGTILGNLVWALIEKHIDI